MTVSPQHSTQNATAKDGVLVVGGYGNVGQRIARLLAKECGDRLLIAGRHKGRAQRFAAAVNGRARVIDIANPESFAGALQGVKLVVMCLDTADLKFAHACIAQGAHYIDITATYAVIERLGYLHDLARANKVTMITSVGLAPGLTNLLAKACVQSSPGKVGHIDLHLLFGLGDHHGRAALEWTVDRLGQPFEIAAADGQRTVIPFQDSANAEFPPPLGERATYRFDFSDQHTLPHTLNVPSVSTWLTFDDAGLARRLSRLARTGVLQWTRYRWLRHLTILLLRLLRAGSSRFAVCVQGTNDSDTAKVTCFTATGVEESHATAVIAAETVRQVLAEASESGVFQLDQRYSLVDFDAVLAENDIVIDRRSAVVDEQTPKQASPPNRPPLSETGAEDERANG